MYVKASEARKYFAVSDDTLRRWAKTEKIQIQKTKGGHRRYYINPKKTQSDSRKSIIYTRVSSKKQQTELINQTKFMQEKIPEYTVISDIGSGLNENRKGLNAILDLLFSNNLKQVVVASKDRFTRFNFKLFQNIFNKFNATLTSLSEQEHRSEEQELSEDLMSIITVFSARYYGRRSYKKRDNIKNKKNSNISHYETKNIL